MGSSETGGVDCSVGSIVWVRRRNGSWWPGKIIGTDELSASHITSPRSGTPVKLLGREDASVDWYNLEKSKRVKAFRCGEFDECIERAEASQGMPPKKREKYARREDAILHALELEKQILEKSGKVGYASNDRNKKSEDVTSSGHFENGSGNPIDPRSLQVSERLDVTVTENHGGSHMHGDKVREGNQLRGDDDNDGVLPRMRGLQDFGLRSAPQKLSPTVASSVSQKPVIVSSTPALPNDAFSADGKVDPNIETLSDNRKRLDESLADESIVKRRDRQRPLIQVLENSAKLPFPDSQPDDGSVSINTSGEGLPGVSFRAKRGRNTYLTTDSDGYLNNNGIHSSQMETSVSKFEESDNPHSADFCEEHTSGSTEDTETDSSETDSLESDSDDEMTALSDGSASIELQPKYPRRIEEQEEHGSMSSDDLDELEFGDDTPRSFHNNPFSASMGVSRWQLKGKRNNRGVMKRSLDRTDAEVSGGYIHGRKSNWSSNGKKSDLIERGLRTSIPGYGSTGPLDGLALNDQSSMRGYWDDSLDPLSAQHHFGGRIMLLDVDLKVQASNYRRDVPIISLMSKLNGHAIIGHPIQVEALENGSSENLLPATDHLYPETSENHTALTPVWRTARRTANFRVPRPHVSSAMSSESKTDLRVVVDQDKGISFGHPQHLDKRFPRNSPRKIISPSNQKIRTLSSIASEPKHSSDQRGGGNNYQADGLMKTQDAPTTVACIPVKLVFSRLHEELAGRHQ
ncbi:Tudor/PWWP/MBT superfamily protein [Forsythia ovata]|uniref:Tudor/PWWP/MBT superfamily protein n=1 Tax=Forsythia ovata TaxID=205694 RepID=A0ABD1WNB3_9LAMI